MPREKQSCGLPGVMGPAEEWESMQETLSWLAQPRIHKDLAEAEEDIAAGRVYDEAQVRRALSLPPRGGERDAPERVP
jgi:antitoxin YefM